MTYPAVLKPSFPARLSDGARFSFEARAVTGADDRHTGSRLKAASRRSAKEAADNYIKCPHSGGWIDISDLGSVADHAGLY